MNRVVIGFLAVLVLFILVIYGSRRLSGFNMRQLLPKTSPRTNAVVIPTASPFTSPDTGVYPTTSPNNILPESGILPATGL